MGLKKKSKVYGHFKHVLILSDVDVHAKRDLNSIKSFAPETVQFFSSGARAADYMSDNKVDLILCDSSLEDMPGVKFANIIRKNMRMEMVPIIMVTLENQKHQVLNAIASGCMGYVLRPYSLDTLERYMTMAMQLVRYPEIEELQMQEAKEMVDMGDFDDAIEAFEEIISYQEDAQHYYDMGYKFLHDSKYGKAIVAFKKALKINDLFAEAYKGLADAYKGKGDDEKCKVYLQKASEVFAQFDRLEEAKQAFIEVLKYESNTPNPYNTLGVKLRQKGDYPGAIHAYSQALELTPEDENIHFNMGKAYYFMGEVKKAGESFDLALSLKPDFEEAQSLYQRIHQKAWKPSKDKPPPRPVAKSSKTARDL